MAIGGTYSFQDFSFTLQGAGGTIQFGNDSAVAEEGITIAMNNPKNTMQGGADGSWQHSLHASSMGTVTIRLLKTSPKNSQLSKMYYGQSLSSLAWGKNVLITRGINNDEQTTSIGVAFQKLPDLTYAQDAGMNEWVFDAGYVTQEHGVY